MKRLIVGFGTLLVLVRIPDVHAAFFQGLGDLGGGVSYSGAYAVSGDGSVVVGYSYSGYHEAFRWTAPNGMARLGELPGGSRFSHAEDVSADGSVIVGQSDSALGDEAFVWTETHGMVGLGDLPGGSFDSEASGVSADGSVVVGAASSSASCASFPYRHEAFRWTQAGGMVGLGDLPGGSFGSRAIDVSADGSVIVGEGYGQYTLEAFRWTESGGMIGLGDLIPGSYVSGSKAYGVSADGSVVVGGAYSRSGYEAFWWTEADGMVGLGDLPGGTFSSTAWDVSADGSVVVGRSRSASAYEAFIWDKTNGMRNLKDILTRQFGLDLTGWTLNDAYGVSDDGVTIVGTGYNPAGKREAWIANISQPSGYVPEPSSVVVWSVLGCLAAALGCCRRKFVG